MQKGRQQGIQEGRQQGIQENSREIAKNMIDDGISYEKISAYTGLSVSEIEKIVNDAE